MIPSGVFPPIMVCVFPLPVWPYANIVAGEIRTNDGTRRATMSNNVNYEERWLLKKHYVLPSTLAWNQDCTCSVPWFSVSNYASFADAESSA